MALDSMVETRLASRSLECVCIAIDWANGLVPLTVSSNQSVPVLLNYNPMRRQVESVCPAQSQLHGSEEAVAACLECLDRDRLTLFPKIPAPARVSVG
jgi:hypothetical protein